MLDLFGDSVVKNTKKLKTLDCDGCGRFSSCRSPKTKVFGDGNKGILLIGSHNNKDDDMSGIPFSGEYGILIKNALYKYGIDITKDCYRTNLVRCGGSTPDHYHYQCCDRFIVEDIERIKPKLIICFGSEAINYVLRPEHLKKFSTQALHGKVIPHHRWGCYVGCMFDPMFIFKSKMREKHIFEFDLKDILGFSGKEPPKPLSNDGNIVLTNVDDALDILDLFCESEAPVAFDYETSHIDPYKDGASIYSVALSNDVNSAVCIPIGFNSVFNLVEQSFLQEKLQKFLNSNCPKIVQNFNMEHAWSVRKLGVEPKNVIWDTMNSYHVANSRKEMTGLAKQVYEMVGFEYKDMVDYNDLLSDVINTGNYNCLDVRYTLMAYNRQKDIIEKNDLVEFNKIYTKAIYPLARFRDRGILVDRTVFDGFKGRCEDREKGILSTLYNIQSVKDFEVLKGSPLNLNSSKQIGELFHDVLCETCHKFTKAEAYSTDDESLNLLLEKAQNEDTKKIIQCIFDLRQNDGFAKRVINWEGFLDTDNRVHPSYLLNSALSYRSSAKDPTSQNIPKHDKYLSEFRKSIIPKNDCLLEVDFAAGEVRGIAMASQDEILLKEILDGYDSHRYWASMLYDKPMDDITKDERFNAKNKFVFPSFYGSEPKAESKNLELPLSTVEKVYAKFWAKYAGVREWQKKMLDFYLKNGYIVGMSGFKCFGPLSNFQVYNIPIQGSTFHILLSALELIEKEFEQKRLLSVPFGEIHDAILFDAKFSEVEQICDIVNPILCSKRFDWMGKVPINVEWSIGSNLKEMEFLGKY